MPLLRRMMFAAACVTVLLSLCLVGACQPATAPTAAAEVEQSANDLANDIALLDTINRLDLQAAQLGPLTQLAERAEQAVAAREPERQAALARLIPLLRQKRDLLLEDKEVPADLENNLRQTRQAVEKAEQQIGECGQALVPDLRKVLSADQISILTGADEARGQAEELLDWVRELSAGTFAEEAAATAEELADPEVNLSAKDIMGIFTAVRKLSEADYAAKKGPHVSRIALLYSPTPEAADDSLAQFLTMPRLALLLREKAAR